MIGSRKKFRHLCAEWWRGRCNGYKIDYPRTATGKDRVMIKPQVSQTPMRCFANKQSPKGRSHIILALGARLVPRFRAYGSSNSAITSCAARLDII